jgi:methylenetetrahydrofolate reductase (NADPH)
MTRIADLLAKGPTYSFEFFPPKNDAEQATLVGTLRDLEPLGPSFVSVTYRGGAESRQRTYDLVTGMLRTTTLVPMAHLICVAHTRLELAEILVAYRRAGVENLMALGGDPPSDPDLAPGELVHASELVELARAIGGFSIGVAAQPGGHPLSSDLERDRDFLAAKLRLADFGVTQPRMATMGAAVPPWMVERLEAADRRGGAEAVRHEGVAIATELCRRLLAEGVPGLHFYTLNRSSATREIYASLGLATPG